MDINIKQQIVQRAQDLFMRYGIKSISMDDIARELGMSKKTLYQYVENKSDLIDQILRGRLENEQEAMTRIREESEDAIEEIVRIADYVIQEIRQVSPTTVYDLQKYYRMTYCQVDAVHQQLIYRVIRDNIERGIRQGVYRQTINPDIIAKLYVGKTSLVADEESFPLHEYNIEELFRQFIYYHIHGIASPKGLELLERHHLADILGDKA